MEKHKTILSLIDKLSLLANKHGIVLVDYWDADLCAIGYKKGGKIMYINSYNIISRPAKGYDYDLEIGDDPERPENFKVVKSQRSITEPELIDTFMEFFEIDNSLSTFTAP